MRIDRRVRRPAAGFSLLELSLVVVIGGIVAAFAIPDPGVGSEAIRVDRAAADLRSIWRAERRHLLETGTLAPDLEGLRKSGYLESGFGRDAEPFAYDVRVQGGSRFAIEALRAGSRNWKGKLTLDETGTLSGGVRNGDGKTVRP
jgi:prepilin-type N-terminal cleavage/methylation domain-containing protein